MVTLEAVLGIGGLVFLILALIGRGLTAKDVMIPAMAGLARVVTGTVGALLIAGALWLHAKDSKHDPVDPQSSAAPTPDGPPPTTPSATPPSSVPPSPPAVDMIEYDQDMPVNYVDNTGHLDLDAPHAWGGDEDEDTKTTDLAITKDQVSSENATKIAASRAGGKIACEQAIGSAGKELLTMQQIRDDMGYCAQTSAGLVVYIRLVDVKPQDNDHQVIFHITAYA
ncbi:hypothetical protein [Dactylosporangium sp. NPDC048998]|uniref:hypothetical protein n=1 Tax=Dactylosporangium sp. NPDC048998 TaxID=3363976 RepID=UPI0037114162